MRAGIRYTEAFSNGERPACKVFFRRSAQALADVLFKLLRDGCHHLLAAAGWVDRRSVELADNADADEAMRRASATESGGDREGALRVLEGAIERGQRSAAIYARAGALCGQLERLERARALLECAIEIDPAHAGALCDLGTVHRLAGALQEAIGRYREALRIAPGNFPAMLGLAHCLRDTGDIDGATAMLSSALERDPRDEQALRALAELAVRVASATGAASAATAASAASSASAANAIPAGAEGGKGSPEAIIRIAGSIAAAHPDNAAAHAALGFMLLKAALDAPAALPHFERAIALGRRDAQTLANRGIALQDVGRVDEALLAYEDSLREDANNHAVRFHRALALLLLGRYAEAWDDYELRSLHADVPRKLPDCPQWDGSPIPGATLLVCAEQGLGDEIMFASCLPEALARSGRCIVDCSPRLAGLFGRSFPDLHVHAVEQRDKPRWEAFGRIDYAIRAGSLPRHFRRSLAQFPRHRGYLQAQPQRVERMRHRLAAAGGPLALGISWRGGTLRSRAPLRSLSLERLLPILRIPGIVWISLQYDARPDEVAQFADEHAVRIVHWQDAIDDYEDTAALVAALELTVSVCTAIVHLCGALGRPARVMAPCSPEWRYGASGETMAWYPSVRIVRQRAPGDWAGVIETVGAELRAMAGSAGAR